MCELPQVYTELWPKARKPHKCCECGGKIQPGEKYRKITGIWGGKPDTFKQCADCAPLYDAANNEESEGIPFGSLWECFWYGEGSERRIAQYDAIAVKRGLKTTAQLIQERKILLPKEVAG